MHVILRQTHLSNTPGQETNVAKYKINGEAPTVQPSALVTVPLFHVTGEVPVFLQSFAMGRKLVLMPKWDAGLAIRLMAEEKVSYFVGVPLMSYEGERDTMDRWAEAKGPEGIEAYWQEKNLVSMDGLPTGMKAGSS